MEDFKVRSKIKKHHGLKAHARSKVQSNKLRRKETDHYQTTGLPLVHKWVSAVVGSNQTQGRMLDVRPLEIHNIYLDSQVRRACWIAKLTEGGLLQVEGQRTGSWGLYGEHLWNTSHRRRLQQLEIWVDEEHDWFLYGQRPEPAWFFDGDGRLEDAPSHSQNRASYRRRRRSFVEVQAQLLSGIVAKVNSALNSF